MGSFGKKNVFRFPEEGVIRCILLLGCCLFYLYIAFHMRVGAQTGGPDERMRSLIPQCIVSGHILPSGYDGCAIYDIGYWSYAFYPQLLGAYVSASFMKVAQILGLGVALTYSFGRLASVLFGLVTLFFVSQTVSLALDKSKYKGVAACGSVVILGFWPQFAFLCSYMNNEIVALSGVAILMYSMVYGGKRGWDLKSVLCLSAGIVACGLGYLNSYGFVLISVLFFIITVLSQYRENRKESWKLIFIAGGISAILVLPFFSLNLYRYHDLLGMNVFHERQLQWMQDTGSASPQHPWTEGLVSLLLRSNFVMDTFQSFVGNFGYMAIPIPFIFCLFFFGSLLTSFGMAVPAICEAMKKTYWRLFGMGVLIACAITIFLFLYYAVCVDYQPQGRYVIYLLIPMVIVSSIGVEKGLPVEKRYVRVAFYIFCLFYAFVTIWEFKSVIAIYGWNGVSASALV